VDNTFTGGAEPITVIRQRGASRSQVIVAAAGSIWRTTDSKGHCWNDRVMQLSVI
jgi:hypothetical protein